MPLHPMSLRLLLAGLVVSTALVPLAPRLLDPRLSTLDPPIAHADGPGDWPMFHHDPAHTGYNPDETQLKPPLRLKWSYTTGGWVFSAPAVSGGVVYAVSDDGKVYALDANSGTLRWTYQTGGAIRSSPAVAGGAVYFGSRDGKVYALDAVNGNLLWSYQTGSDVYSPPAVASGVVYVGSEDGKVYALDGGIGTLRWSFNAGRVSGSPAVAGGAVYVGSSTGTGNVYALDATTGTLLWSYNTGNLIFSSPVVTGNVVYVGSINQMVYALDAASGTVLWGCNTGERVESTPAVGGAVVYMANQGGMVYAFDASPGTLTGGTRSACDSPAGALRWSRKVGTAIQSSPILANGLVYLGSNDKNVYALDAETGVVRWSYATNGAVPSVPAVANGVLYVGSNDFNVYAFEGVPPPSAMQALSPYQAISTPFTLSWTIPVTWTGTPATSYDVQYREGSSASWTDLITATASLSTTFSGQDGHTYYIRARATTTTGAVGDWSDPVSTTVDLTAPRAKEISINGGALDTPSASVTLVLSATDSLSGISQASYSSDGSSWSGWETYAATTSWTLPTGEGEKTVWARFRDAAGNISATVSDTLRLDTSVAPTYGFSINEGALFTNQVTVTLSLPANPSTAQMMVSNDGGFYGAAWEPYAAYRPWAITQYGSYVIARTVYVKFKDVTGNVYGAFSDEIILDVNAPSGSVSIEGAGAAGVQGQGARVQALMPHASAWGGDSGPLPRSPLSANGEGVGGEVARAAATSVTLKLSASDDWSGVGGMMVSNSPAFSGASWEPFSASKAWSLESGGKVYVAFKDNAGNASPIYAAALSGAKESLPAVALGTVHPKTGGTLTSSDTGTTVAFPPGAVAAKAEVTLVPAVESNLQANTGALKSAGKFLTLTAKAGETSLTSVSKAYTITVGYTTADVAGVNESTLGIYWWNGSAWQKEPTSRVDTAARTVSAALDHLSAFAVLGESSTRAVYLPLVLKSYGAGW